MGKEHVELRVHMYHEPVGTRVTRVNGVCGVDPAGWSAEREVRSGEVPPWVETESDGRQPFSPETGETVDRVTGRPFPGRYWSSHDLRSPHVLEAVAQAGISDPRLCEVRAPEGGTLSVRMILA